MKLLITGVACMLFLYSQSQVAWQQTVDSCNFFSSPNSADLNQDGIQDIIIGGGVEYLSTRSGVLAFDGKSGKLLWRVPARSQIYTSAILQDITNDQVPEVFIGGRDALFFCINGKTGEKIWEFWNDSLPKPYGEGWYNFYNCSFIDDQNNDGFQDLLLTNGGDHYALPNKKTRPTANMMIISAKDGKTIKLEPISEKKESYYAPHTFTHKKKEYLVYGSGGETVGGSLRIIPFKTFLSKGLARSKVLLTDTVKGFILNSVIAHLDFDAVPDLVAIHMDGQISAISSTGKTLWNHKYPGFENYVTPALGYFNDDTIPDVFTIFAQGQFPAYQSFKAVIFDGNTGKTLYEANEGINQFSPAVSLDLNTDGNDDFLYVENQMNLEKMEITWRLKLIDSRTQKAVYLTEPLLGCSMASSPLVLDMDNDGKLEVIVSVTSIDMVNERTPSSYMYRIQLAESGPITWGKYLGPTGNGNFLNYR